MGTHSLIILNLSIPYLYQLLLSMGLLLRRNSSSCLCTRIATRHRLVTCPHLQSRSPHLQHRTHRQHPPCGHSTRATPPYSAAFLSIRLLSASPRMKLSPPSTRPIATLPSAATSTTGP